MTKKTDTEIHDHQGHKGGPDAHPPAGNPSVEIYHTGAAEAATIHVPWTTTLGEVWVLAYTKLGQERKEGDTLLCDDEDGESLMNYLDRTLEEFRGHNGNHGEPRCDGRKLKIRTGTGGAVASAGQTPVPVSPAEAVAALEADLPRVLRGRTLKEAGW